MAGSDSPVTTASSYVVFPLNFSGTEVLTVENTIKAGTGKERKWWSFHGSEQCLFVGTTHGSSPKEQELAKISKVYSKR